MCFKVSEVVELCCVEVSYLTSADKESSMYRYVFIPNLVYEEVCYVTMYYMHVLNTVTFLIYDARTSLDSKTLSTSSQSSSSLSSFKLSSLSASKVSSSSSPSSSFLINAILLLRRFLFVFPFLIVLLL